MLISHNTLDRLTFSDDALLKLIDELETTFPGLVIHPKMSSEEIMYKAGQASVVNYIKSKLENK